MKTFAICLSDTVLKVAEVLKYGKPCLPIRVMWEWKHPTAPTWKPEKREHRFPVPVTLSLRDFARDEIHKIAERDGLIVRNVTVTCLEEKVVEIQPKDALQYP